MGPNPPLKWSPLYRGNEGFHGRMPILQHGWLEREVSEKSHNAGGTLVTIAPGAVLTRWGVVGLRALVTHTHSMRWHAHYHTSGTGHIYQGRFKSFPVETDEHFYTVLRYVERNALRANLTRRAENW